MKRGAPPHSMKTKRKHGAPVAVFSVIALLTAFCLLVAAGCASVRQIGTEDATAPDIPSVTPQNRFVRDVTVSLPGKGYCTQPMSGALLDLERDIPASQTAQEALKTEKAALETSLSETEASLSETEASLSETEANLAEAEAYRVAHEPESGEAHFSTDVDADIRVAADGVTAEWQYANRDLSGNAVEVALVLDDETLWSGKLQPGESIDGIILDQPLPAGEHEAMVVTTINDKSGESQMTTRMPVTVSVAAE